jgi:hypothetical protein
MAHCRLGIAGSSLGFASSWDVYNSYIMWVQIEVLFRMLFGSIPFLTCNILMGPFGIGVP